MSSSATSSVSTCKLVSRHEVAERTMAFHFEKPAGWTFKAGQYSNRRPEDAPFLEELEALGEENPNYTLIASMTDMGKSHQPWQGETGLINKEMLARYVKDAVSPIYYIAGP